jgi:hypothetical protein
MQDFRTFLLFFADGENAVGSSHPAGTAILLRNFFRLPFRRCSGGQIAIG